MGTFMERHEKKKNSFLFPFLFFSKVKLPFQESFNSFVALDFAAPLVWVLCFQLTEDSLTLHFLQNTFYSSVSFNFILNPMQVKLFRVCSHMEKDLKDFYDLPELCYTNLTKMELGAVVRYLKLM